MPSNLAQHGIGQNVVTLLRPEIFVADDGQYHRLQSLGEESTDICHRMRRDSEL
jgi:hypothetical protein